jgi:hypothetical protein
MAKQAVVEPSAAQSTSDRESEKRFRCDQCDRVYLKYSSLLEHMAVVHYRRELSAHLITRDNLYTCSRCKVNLSSLNAARMHLVKVHKVLGSRIPTLASFPKPLREKKCVVAKFRGAWVNYVVNVDKKNENWNSEPSSYNKTLFLNRQTLT